MSWLNCNRRKRQKSKKSQKPQTKKMRKTFILEPLITPSVLVDGSDRFFIPDIEALELPAFLLAQLDSSTELDLPNLPENVDPSFGEFPDFEDSDHFNGCPANLDQLNGDNSGDTGTVNTSSTIYYSDANQVPLVITPIDPDSPLATFTSEDEANDQSFDNFEFPQQNQPLIGIIDTGFSANNPDLDYSKISLGQDRVDG
ncbi:MAG: hypothetical protein ACOC04_04185, partial [Halothece sp.]